MAGVRLLVLAAVALVTACGALGPLIVDGQDATRAVCELEAGHDKRRWEQWFTHPSELDAWASPTPHEFKIEWKVDGRRCQLCGVACDPSCVAVDFGPVGDGRAPMYGGSDDDGI